MRRSNGLNDRGSAVCRLWLSPLLPGLLAVLTILALPAHGHPELLTQIEVLNAQLEQQPASAEYLSMRGDLHRRHGDYQAAAADFESARNSGAGYPMLDFYEGHLLLDLGDAVGSARLLSRYLETHPGHGRAWILFGKASMLQDLPLEAAEHFARAIEAAPRPSPELYRLHILSLVAAGESATDAALQAVDEGLQRFPLEAGLLGLGTDIALVSDRPARAEKYLARLPQPLHGLPRWAQRFDTATCLDSTQPDSRESCLRSLNERMARQLEDLTVAQTHP